MTSSLFAINPFIGENMNGMADFPTAKSLLEHLDYLGIDRSLVSSNVSISYSPIVGNRELLAEIAPYRDRLYPCLVLTPADFYEKGNMSFIHEQLKAGNRAFSLCYSECKFELRDLERVIADIADEKPVFFLNARFNTQPQVFSDVEMLASRYPDVTFVCTKQMWGKFPSTLNLMWKCRNVMLDISWLHMRDAIEMLARDFGAERLLFGIGGKSHYGAAIGSLARSGLTDAEKELVAHGNLERILGLTPVEKPLFKYPPLLDEKPIWKGFLAGKKLSELVDFPVVDSHAHTGSLGGGWCIPESHYDLSEYFAAFVKFMDRNGVAKIVDASERALMGDSLKWNAEAERCAAKYPGRFNGWFSYNANYSENFTEETMDGFFRRGYFAGIKLLPSYQKVPVTDSRYDSAYRYADKHHLPVLCHTWGDKYDAPCMFKSVLPKYPGMRLIIGHSGGSELKDRLDAEAMLREFPNVYLDSCAIFCCERPWHLAIQEFGNGRMTLGSDAGPHNESFELSNVLSLPLPDKELLPILGLNWQRLMNEVLF